MSNSNLARLILLGAIWGTSFMLMRIAAPVFGPILTTFGPERVNDIQIS